MKDYTQQFKVDINLPSAMITKTYETKIRDIIVAKYSGKCYINCYIKPNTIKIISIGRGVKKGAGLHGSPTYNVVFTAKCVILKTGDIVSCKVTNKNQYCIVCETNIIDVIFIAKYVQDQNHELGNTELEYSDINQGDIVNVYVLESSVHRKKYTVCGYVLDVPNIRKSLPIIMPEINITITYADGELKEDTSRDSDMYITLTESENKINPVKDEWKAYITSILAEDFYPITRYSYASGKISRAYNKIMEILTQYDILTYKRPLTICCLAEAPGGFYKALLDYREKYCTTHGLTDYTHDKYGLASYIDPKYIKSVQGAIDDDNIYFNDAIPDENIIAGSKVKTPLIKPSGNLMSADDINDIVQRMGGEHTCDVITADGGMGVGETAFKEGTHYQLFFGEIVTALRLQKEGGSFVLKVYSIVTKFTYDLITLLTKYYDQVYIHKPFTSKDSNTEKYLVCLGFKSIEPNQDSINLLFEAVEKWTPTIHPVLEFDMSDYDTYESGINSIVDYNNATTVLSTSKVNEYVKICYEMRNAKDKKAHFAEILKRLDWYETVKENCIHFASYFIVDEQTLAQLFDKLDNSILIKDKDYTK